MLLDSFFNYFFGSRAAEQPYYKTAAVSFVHNHDTLQTMDNFISVQLNESSQ